MYMSSDGKSLEFVGNMLERKHLSKLKPVLEVSYYQESWGGGGVEIVFLCMFGSGE